MMGKDIKQLQNLIEKLEQLQSNDSKNKDKENSNTINL